jgi:hypothetical protein
MEINEGGESSKKLSPPRTLLLTSLRISERKRSSPTLAPCWDISWTPSKAFWPKAKTIRGGPFSSHNLSTLLLSAPKQGASNQEIWTLLHAQPTDIMQNVLMSDGTADATMGEYHNEMD